MSSTRRDINGIRQILLARRTALRDRHDRIGQDLQRRNEPLVGDADDRAIQLENDDALYGIDRATENELATINEALRRLDQGLYGICKRCGSEIEAARLQALHAVTCATCATD